MTGGGRHGYPQFTQSAQPPNVLVPFPFTTTTITTRDDGPVETTILTSESDILNIRGTEVISSNASAPIYNLSAPCHLINSVIILSSVSNEALYKLEYLGERNSIYLRPANEGQTPANVYPGFGELKYGHGSGLKSMGTRIWTVRYGEGRDTVLSCKDGKWIEFASGQTIAIERKVKRDDANEEEELEFLVESDLLDRGGIVRKRKELIRGLVVAAWTGRCWHSATFLERNEKEGRLRRASSSSRTSVGRRNTNRFLGNLFSNV